MDKDKQPKGNASANANGTSNGADGLTSLETRFSAAQDDLSTSRQRLLRQILAEPHETFFLSSREMGRRYNVDSATIVRTVQALGYKKFADFARDLRNHFVTQITPYAAMRVATQKHRSVADYVHQSIATDTENLNALKSTLNAEQVVEVAKLIHRSRRILIVGADYAASLAMSMAYGLARLGCDAEAPTASLGAVQNKVKMLTRNDLLIAITFGQGLRITVEAVLHAKEQNVPTIGFTDNSRSPVAKYCDQSFVASIERSSWLDSYVAPVALINAILVACAHTKTKRALELLAQSEKDYSNGTRWYQENEDNKKNKQG